MPLSLALGIALALRPTVEIPACVSTDHRVDLERVRYLVDIELDSALAEGGETPHSIAVSCTKEGVTLQTIAADGKVLDKRSIDLSKVEPSVGARLIALGVAELVTDEPKVAEEPAPPEEPAAPEEPEEPPPPEPPPPPVQPDRRWHLDVGPAARGYLTGRAGTFGLEFGVRHRLPGFVGWRASLSGQGGFARAGSLGRITIAEITAAAFVLLQQRYGRADPYAGIGVRGGWARMIGSPRDDAVAEGSTLDGGWFGPAGTLGLDVVLRGSLLLGIAVEAGWAPIGLSARVDDARDPSLAGPWFGGRLGLGARL